MAKKLAGSDRDYWFNRLGVNEEELEGYFSQMIRNSATSRRQGLNRVDEIAAAQDLPLSAQLAMEQSVDLAGQRAVTQGTESLQRYASEANRNAWSQILSGELTEKRMELEEEMADEAFWAQIIGDAAGAAGTFAGAKYGG